MKTAFRWGFIGCGWIAEQVAEDLNQSSNHVIRAVWNRTMSRAQAFCQKYGGTVYEELDDLLSAPDIDGVYIAVTADKHAEFMKSAIKHHKPVLCEKPFTVNAKEAQEVFAYAQAEGVYVSEAMWTWHNDVAKFVKKSLKEQRLGQLQDFQCHYSLPMVWTYPVPRLTERELIGGAIMDIGVYALRYCYELFGYPEKIHCTGDIKNGVDLNEEVTLEYPEILAKLSIGIAGSKGEELTIFGSKGTLQVPDFHMAKRASIYGQAPEQFEAMRTLLFLTQFDRVAKEMRGECPQEISIQSTIDVMHMLDDCRQQMGVVYPSEEI